MTLISEETLKTVLIVIAVMFIYNKLSSTKEGYSRRYAALPGANNMVLTDEKGNLSSIQFPKRMIMIWAGELSQIPDGWALCNGDNETPDLRSKFVIGVNPNTKKNGYGVKEMKAEGGAEIVSFTISQEQMPQHTHNYGSIKYTGGNSPAHGPGGRWDNGMWNRDWVGPSESAGGNQPVSLDKMPPYYALAYIMKIV